MSKFVTAKQFFKGFSKAFEGPQHGGKVATIGAVKPSKNLTKRRKDFEDLVKTTDKYTKNLTKEGQISVKKTVAPAAKKISGIHDKYEKKLGPGSSNPRAKKAGGGIMGRRMGYSQGSSKGKVPTTPKEKAFGMLSVKKGLDKNKNITFTDKIAGAKKA